MEQFRKAYAHLNAAQKHAVDTIYGPLLVIAGPGTGKTQLLSARVAHILEATDVLPQNILCLTFTENGALNMRERLTGFIGPQAYDVAISTYHGFGSNIISRFPEYFSGIRLERPIDELDKHQLLTTILEEVDYRSPIKQVRHHLGDLVSTISELKRGLVTPDILRTIANTNLAFISGTAPQIAEILMPYEARMPAKVAVALPLWREVYQILQQKDVPIQTSEGFPTLQTLALLELEAAIDEAGASEKTSPLTAWKNTWLMKDNSGHFRLKGTLEAKRANALADVLAAYDAALRSEGLYDFEDMILEAISSLEQNDELRYTLQEQYQFILLDEFQDTNRAQLHLIELLTNNPVHEGRPNVMAVGDDDQAIYAFQGAEVSNIREFMQLYHDVTVITLSENYRSTQDILQAASTVASQISSRLKGTLHTGADHLIAAANDLPPTKLERREYASDIAERQGIAEHIQRLITAGANPSTIAVLSPKHRNLESLVPYLQALGIPVRYEKRENILDSPRIKEIIAMSELVIALSRQKHDIADSLWPQVLSYPFWQFPVADIWQLSWKAYDTHTSWSERLLASQQFRHAALLILALASQVATESAEEILDGMIGRTDVATNDQYLPNVRSPFYDYYRSQNPTVLFETATELTVLREKFRTHRTKDSHYLSLADLIEYVASYQAAGQQMINTSPHNQADSAVELMTVHKAKGLEWDTVIIIDAEDEVWGSKSGANSNKLTLPRNLESIRHAGTSEDEKLRLFFVALTRAKHGLYLMSHHATYDGRQSERLKYLNEIEEGDEVMSRTLPEQYQKVIKDSSVATDLATIERNWPARHIDPDTSLKSLLRERLAHYRLSPTHLTKFIDLKYGGPERFLIDIMLRFPVTPSTDSHFGNAVHAALEWWQQQINAGRQPQLDEAVMQAYTYLDTASLSPIRISQQQQRIATTLKGFLTARGSDFRKGNKPEQNFSSEGVIIGDALLGGKIDLLEIDAEKKQITVVDYKTTGKVRRSWKPLDLTLHKYQLQLYCYQLLVEESQTYRGYKVPRGKIVFTEPDEDGKYTELIIDFTSDEAKRTRQLLQALWATVQSLDFPTIESYGTSLTEVRRFEDTLLASWEDRLQRAER